MQSILEFVKARDPQSGLQHPQWFASTHWSVILGAAESELGKASEALDQLCQTYWTPVNAFVRRMGHTPEDADDLTQQFFARFLEKKQYLRADPTRGKFRTFLLTVLRNYLVNEYERAHAKKRGGGREVASLDATDGEANGPRLEIADDRTALSAFDRSWALTLLAQVRTRLHREYAAEGKADRFEQLEKLFPGEENVPTYAEVAARLGLAEGTIKSDMHWLKRRYGEVLREEVAHTAGTPAEADEELRSLLAILSRQAE